MVSDECISRSIPEFRANIPGALWGKSKWGLLNEGLRPLLCAFVTLSKVNFRHKMTTIVGNCGQVWIRLQKSTVGGSPGPKIAHFAKIANFYYSLALISY